MQTSLYKLSPPTYHLYDRLRQKVRPWVESTAQKHQRERRSADYLLLSLTNCGRTWLRVILGKAMQLHYNTGGSLDDLNLHDLFRFSEAVPLLPSIKPMHEKYGQFGNSYAGQKVILLVRDPRDALVSRYHQHKDALSFGSLEDYVTNGPDLAAYIQFYNDWQTHRDTAQSLLVVRYEDMKSDTCGEVSRVFDFLQVSVTSDEVQQAVDYASFKNMRKMELEGSQQVRAGVMSSRKVNQPESFKVRKGAIGGYRSELSDEAIQTLDSAVKTQLDPIYGYQ
ncbi:MAG: sulfotransferase domain-containing protein [Cyanobacteria bacterium J06650_10]